MTYKETVAWMFEQLPMYQKKGVDAYKGKLDNIISFASHLDNPQNKFKSIHVGGTNGKGSSSHMLASILQEAGYKVGLYTSPHLKDFRERIKINGKKVSKQFVKDFIANNKSYLDYNGLSFFEMTVGLAFTHFACEKVDIAIIEVGLGGRLDSTNIITPEVSLITNIGFDHMQILGDTLEKIAMEKAGIIKRTVPVVVSEKHVKTEMVFKLIAGQLKSKLIFAEDVSFPKYKLGLKGAYQSKNVKGVLACLRELKGFKVKERHIENGLVNVVDNTGLLGRWQRLGKSPLIICDTAHNEEGLKIVTQQITEQQYKELFVVLGFVNDKEVIKLLKLFPEEANFIFVEPKIPRALKLEDLESIVSQVGLNATFIRSVSAGYELAKSKAKKNDMIYIGGSTFVVAEIL